MAEAFQTFDLGRVLSTAEAIKGMRQESVNNGLRQKFLQTNIDNAQQSGQIAANQEAREQSKYSEEERLQNTRTLNVAATAVAKDPSSITYWLPVLKQNRVVAADFDPTSVPPEQLQQIAAEIAEHTGTALHAAMAASPKAMELDYQHRLKLEELAAQNKNFTLGQGQTRFGADGKPVASVAPAPEKGMKFQSDGAGGFTLYEGENADGLQLGVPPRNDLQKGAINAQAGIDRLAGIRQGFDPKWLTYKEQAKQFANSVKAKSQGLPFVSNLKPEEQSDLASFSRFKGDTLDNLNRYITEITGAAMGVEEAKRIVATMPNMGDDPSSFQSKMDRVEERLKLVLARSVYTQKNGIKFDAMPIDQMRSVIHKRGEEIYQQQLAQTRDAAAAKAATVQAIDQEFYQ